MGPVFKSLALWRPDGKSHMVAREAEAGGPGLVQAAELGVEPFLKGKGKKRAGVWPGATPLASVKAVGSILSTETSKQADGFAQRGERVCPQLQEGQPSQTSQRGLHLR